MHLLKKLCVYKPGFLKHFLKRIRNQGEILIQEKISIE